MADSAIFAILSRLVSQNILVRLFCTPWATAPSAPLARPLSTTTLGLVCKYMHKVYTCHNALYNFFTPVPVAMRSITMSVSVCLYVYLPRRLSQKLQTCPKCTKLSVHDVCGRTWLFGWKWNTLCTSGLWIVSYLPIIGQ